MIIEYITNASFLFTLSDGSTILTDPWYTDGIYHGMLFNYPPLARQQRENYLNLNPTYIYISHIHGDHLDGETLSSFDKNTPLLIGKFPTPSLRLALVKLGFVNIFENDFDELQALGTHKICILKEFSSSSDDIENKTKIPVDSSIYIQDGNGDTVFFAVDNPMQERTAVEIKQKFSNIDVAILAYSGASIFPFVFLQYNREEKQAKVDALKQARLKKFCQLAEILDAKRTIPAAGSFVLGGVGADYAEYQHQACPAEITQAWQQASLVPEQLQLMATGDKLTVNDLSTKECLYALNRHFSHQDRVDYAQSIRSFPCDLHDIVWPETLTLPLKSLIYKARANMWKIQESLNCFPSNRVYLVVKSCKKMKTESNETLYVEMDLAFDRVMITASETLISDVPRIEFYMTTQLLTALLLGSTYWNVAEYHMKINRIPDVFEPTLRSLLAFFKL